MCHHCGVRYLVYWFVLVFGSANAADPCVTRIAVASNFGPTLKGFLRAAAADQHGPYQLIQGSSGKLFAQIQQGAPFDIFFSADVEKPLALESEALTESPAWTYAIGRLALWVPQSTASTTNLLAPVAPVATANPRHAPYGVAADSWLRSQSLDAYKRVVGENVGQAFHFVASGNARSGIVALAQLVSANIATHEYRVIPANQHPPIVQSAVILKNDMRCESGRNLIALLRSDDFDDYLATAGYGAPER